MPRAFSSQSKSLVLLVVSLGLGLIFNWFFYEKAPGISMPLFIGVIAVALPLVSRVWGVRVPRSAWIALLGAILFAAWVAVRTSPFLDVLDTLFSLYLVGMAVLLTAGIFDWGKILSFLRIPFLPINFVGTLPWSLARMTELRNREEMGTSGQVVRGILMALPVLFVFILLFASADLVIREYLMRIFNIENLPEFIGRTVLVVAFSLFSAGTLGYALSGGDGGRRDAGRSDNLTASRKEQGRLGTLQMSVFLGAIAALFLGFIVVQAAYLFGGEATLVGRGFTYAEYARHGFFELLAVAILTFLMLWASERSVMRSGKGHSRQFKVVAGVLAVQVILIIASAFMRLSLYESAFGFTTMRLWSHAFTILLAVFFVLFVLKIWRDGDDRSFLIPAFFAAALALFVMNVLNPDVFIAQRNIGRFSRGERFDASHLLNLSDDAIKEQLIVLDTLQGDEKANFGQVLLSRYEQRLQSQGDTSWFSWNYARRRAASMLETRRAALEAYRAS